MPATRCFHRRHQPLCLRVVRSQLAIVDGTAILQEPGDAIAWQRRRSEDFRQPPFTRAAPHFHLPHPVLRHDVALREKQIVGGLRVDVRHAPAVTNDAYLRAQARNRRGSVDHGKTGGGEAV